MLGSRRGRPGLIGRAAQTAARTALISATATAVSGKVAGRQATAAAATPSAAPATPQAAHAGGLTDESIAMLKQLAELHAAGILTDAEFAEQKARLLA
jgi:putative oligomerization/nucleic acid binding protein